MQHFQDTATGMIWAFDDGVNPSDYSSTPSTLSATIKEKPSEAHIWQNGAWVLDAKLQQELNRAETANQIIALEATITPRRIREAVLGTDTGWLAEIEAHIAALRQQLK